MSISSTHGRSNKYVSSIEIDENRIQSWFFMNMVMKIRFQEQGVFC
jgi:hypothetical protein